MNIIFISKNEHKFNESKRLFDAELNFLKLKGDKLDINLIRMEDDSVEEIQTEDVNKLIKDKLLKAYKIYKRPVLIEHTILKIECLNGYPNAQTSGFWDTISKEDDKPGELLCKIVDKLACNNEASKKAIAKTIYCYSDGKNIITVEDEVTGSICDEPRGDSKFQWDVIFVPDDKEAENKTFAQLEAENTKNGTRKDLFSMRSKAMKKFVNELKDKYNKSYYNIGLYNNHIEDIASRIKEKKLILFVGSGVSSSLNLTSWKELLAKLGDELGFKDKDIFFSLGDNLELAEYYSIEKNEKLDNLMDCLKNGNDISELEKKLADSNVHKKLVNLGVDTIYTTNYEDLIERAFQMHNPNKKYDVIYDLETLNKAEVGNVEVVKLHGDLNKEEEIVLTQTSYFKRYDFEDCLDIKLRNDLLTKSVLFMGYSFSDPNIKYMMHKLNSIWDGKDNKHRPKSYIFLTENNPVQRKIIENNNNMITIVTEKLDKTKALEEFLSKINENVK